MLHEDRKKEDIISELKVLRSSLTKKGFHWEWDFTKSHAEVDDPEKTLKSAIEELEKEIEQRKRDESRLRKSKEDLELQVSERTADLKKINSTLLKEIKERTKVERALRAGEVKYRVLFEQSNDPIVLLDSKGRIIDGNTKIPEILGVGVEALKSSSILKFAPRHERGLIKEFIAKTIEKGSSVYESSIKRADATIIDVEISSSLIDKDSGHLQSVIRNITERKRVESEMKKRLMKFNLKDRSLYLVKESTPVMAVEAMNDLIRVGYSPAVLSRTPKEIFEAHMEGDFTYHWLSERSAEDSVAPKMGAIIRRISPLPRKSAVLIDRLEYIHTEAGHRKTLMLIHRLKELAHFSDQIIICTADPSTLDARILKVLEKEAMPVETVERDRLSEDLLEILGFVLNETIKGGKPSFTTLGSALRISKPTARKRIRRLITSGHLHIISRGNKKILELTEAGNRIFQK